MITLKEKTKDITMIEYRIAVALHRAGIKPHLSGFAYLQAEVLLLLTESPRCRAMQLYERVAADYGISCGSVERMGRYAINYAYDHTHDRLQRFMDNNDDDHVPSHFEFVSRVALIVKNELFFDDLL